MTTLKLLLAFAFACAIYCLIGFVLGNEYAEVPHKRRIDSLFSAPPSVPPINLHVGSGPTKMSQFEITDSIQGGYLIGVLQTKDGSFKNVKYSAEQFVSKEEATPLLKLSIEGFAALDKRLKKLETKAH